MRFVGAVDREVAKNATLIEYLTSILPDPERHYESFLESFEFVVQNRFGARKFSFRSDQF